MSPAAAEMLSAGCFFSGAVLASLGEYATHRLMHLRKLFAERHRQHHRRNSAQGVIGEFLDYCKGGVPSLLVFGVPLWLLTVPSAAVAFVTGGLLYGLFAAYSHQLQHENPTRCFWMKMPVHYVHHKFNMWHHNFGIGVDVWDRLFGTYRAVEWLSEHERELAARGPLEIKWV